MLIYKMLKLLAARSGRYYKASGCCVLLTEEAEAIATKLKAAENLADIAIQVCHNDKSIGPLMAAAGTYTQAGLNK